MNGHDSNGVSKYVEGRLRGTPLDRSPFPHLVVRDALPPDYYAELIRYVREAPVFVPAEYPGTGRFTARLGGVPSTRQGADHHGLVFADWSSSPLLRPLHEFFCNDSFSRALLERFSEPGSRGGSLPAIPVEKHSLFADGGRDYTCVFALHKDLAGYEISPHRDHPSKIVTFLLYIDDDWSRPCGTHLCRPRAGIDLCAADDYRRARRDGRTGLWMDWDGFETVKEVCGPNVFLAFAPNDISFHGVRLHADEQGGHERILVRGFIARTGYRDITVLDDAAH